MPLMTGSLPRSVRRRLAAALAITAIAPAAFAQDWAGKPPIPDDLRAAMAEADKGDPAALLRLADTGRADAQFYAGGMLVAGHGSIAADPVRGCAYMEKASASRADAMHLTADCYRRGLGGTRDLKKAKAAFARADQMGYPKSKCALGQMLLAEPAQAPQGLALCRQAAEAGDVDAQVTTADIYFNGHAVKRDPAEARKWYEKAANQQSAEAARKLGDMYAAGDGGRRDKKKAMGLWQTAEKGGDPFAPILVADQMFSDMTGGRKPEPGKFAFQGGIPVADIDVVEDWYRQALKRDPRPEVRSRAELALSVLSSFKVAAKSAP